MSRHVHMTTRAMVSTRKKVSIFFLIFSFEHHFRGTPFPLLLETWTYKHNATLRVLLTHARICLILSNMIVTVVR